MSTAHRVTRIPWEQAQSQRPDHVTVVSGFVAPSGPAGQADSVAGVADGLDGESEQSDEAIWCAL